MTGPALSEVAVRQFTGRWAEPWTLYCFLWSFWWLL